jgi:hypothetical protein
VHWYPAGEFSETGIIKIWMIGCLLSIAWASPLVVQYVQMDTSIGGMVGGSGQYIVVIVITLSM